MIQLIDFSVYF